MSLVQDTGEFVWSGVRGAGYTIDLCLRTFLQLWAIPLKFRAVLDQMFAAGVRTLPVTALVAVFAGMILSLQTGIELQNYGSESMIGTIVAVSMAREMGPFITGIILAAAVGSKMAAELGTMNVSEEVLALEVMSIDPVRFLVMPRVVALALMCPILTVFSDLVGIYGGGIVAESHLNVGFAYYTQTAVDALSANGTGLPKDVWVGLFKALVFGVTIATVGCAAGLRAQEGALGVGRGVQQSVRNSIILIIVLGYIITWFFYKLLG